MSTKSVRELLDEALDAFDAPGTSVASLVRKAIRIANKRQDYAALLRLMPETFDLTAGKLDHPGFVEARRNLCALLGDEEGEREAIRIVFRQHRDRTQPGSEKINAKSIAQLEDMLAQTEALLAQYRLPPEGLTPIDTYFVSKSRDDAAGQVLPIRTELVSVIERVRQSVHDVLLDMEHQLEVGQRRPSAFQRGQEYVTEAAARHAPALTGLLEAAEAGLLDGDNERLTHALTSCRRAIKALADALYPATDEPVTGADGKVRVMSDDAYRNRLLQFAVERLGRSAHGDLVRDTLEGLGNRLERLTELSSKGVHAVVTRDEAETCVMWTYLTIADFLRLADGDARSSGGVPAGA